MKTKTEVETYIDGLLTYSQAQDGDNADAFESLLAPLKAAVSAYFAESRSDFTAPINDLAIFMKNEIWARTAVWKNVFPDQFGINPPASYTDLRSLFYTFPFMSTTQAAFFAAWVYETPEAGGTEDSTGGAGTVTPVPVSNPLIDEWCAALERARGDELSAVESLTSWVMSSLGNSIAVSYWENRGGLISSQTVQELATEIFITRGLLEAITTLGLPAYVPSYVKGDE